MPDYDVAVIGAGHNALITAAYAARAGYRVGVFERRGIAGGAVSTLELIPGYRFDLGGSAHILIRLTPIVEELELASYGLEYLDLAPLFFAPFADGDAVFFYRDAERTAAGIERTFPGEGEAYLRFLEEWRPFAQAMRKAFIAVPSPLKLGQRDLFRSGQAGQPGFRPARPDRFPAPDHPGGSRADGVAGRDLRRCAELVARRDSSPPVREGSSQPGAGRRHGPPRGGIPLAITSGALAADRLARRARRERRG